MDKKKLSCLWDGSIFFWSTKKNEKLTGQLVGQGTDQNQMDVTNDIINLNSILTQVLETKGVATYQPQGHCIH